MNIWIYTVSYYEDILKIISLITNTTLEEKKSDKKSYMNPKKSDMSDKKGSFPNPGSRALC